MTRIDPHTHSALSDGTDMPAVLMERARDAQLDVLGLTDHDTFAGWDEAAAAVAHTGVALLRGAELSCSWDNLSVHLLLYLPNPDDTTLADIFARSLQSRATRAQEMVNRLAADYPITQEDVLRWAPDDGPIGRPHIADALVEVGAFPDRAAAFVHALHPSGPYYVDHWSPDPVAAVEAVRNAGGVPVLAHPRARGRSGRVLPEGVIENMREAGLFGVEVHHRDHRDEDRREVHEIAQRLGLYEFGSSDHHGTGKPNQLGENLTAPEVLSALEEQGYMEVIYP
ncbi:MAG: PHP domain-containing protein [Actinomycetaceae bacterium]|nr:PHP domain-containing protein [Actinomycetaceae bacterium]